MQFCLGRPEKLLSRPVTWGRTGLWHRQNLKLSAGKTKHSPQQLLDSFFYYGNRHAIDRMEELHSQLSQKFPELSSKIDEAKVKFYLNSDIKAKADVLIQKCP